MRGRLADQALILEAIGKVRSELRWDMTMVEKSEVLVRLCTLYSLLDVARLKGIVEKIDNREVDDNKEAA